MVFGQIISSIVNGIKTFIDNTPKPIKFCFFLISILLLGGIINTSLHIFGVYCDSGNNPVNVGMVNGVSLLDDLPNPELFGSMQVSTSKYHSVISQCSAFRETGVMILEDGIKENFTDRYFYSNDGCTVCESAELPSEKILGLFTYNSQVCKGDVYRIPDENKSFTQKTGCLCEPPKGYFYSYRGNSYICEDNSCEGQTESVIWDNKLNDKDAVPFYPEGKTNNIDYRKAVGFICEDYKPKIAVFGINIFNYKYWVALTVIFILTSFLFRIKSKK